MSVNLDRLTPRVYIAVCRTVFTPLLTNSAIKE
jgi:hypothetical protein